MMGRLRSFWALCVAIFTAATAPSPGRALQPPPLDSIRDLPLRTYPVSGPSPLIALVMTGDGNWAPFVSGVARALVAQGIPVVGLASRTYLSRPRTPAELTSDMVRVLRHHTRLWGADRVLIVGYSRGADFAPFLINRMPADLRAQVAGVGLFSPTRRASFEFHLTDLVRYTPRPTDRPAIPEVTALTPLPVVCVYGTRDADTLCPLLPEGAATLQAEDAGHRLQDPDRLVRFLLDTIRREPDAGER